MLKIPCTYQGAKQRYSKQIIDYILEDSKYTSESKFYDLCCGSGAITIELINRGFCPSNITMVDKSMWGTFWKSVSCGEFNLLTFKEIIGRVPDDKNLIQDYVKDIASKPIDEYYIYNYIILQSCSFGGKQVDIKNGLWTHSGFRNYWQPTETSIRKSPVNPMQPSKEELIKRIELIVEKCKGINCINDDINNISHFDKDNIIYIDPPYINTTGYNYSIDVKTFTDKHKNNKIYVSEKTKLSDEAVNLTLNGAKGGITAKKKSRDEEWLNIFKTNKLND